MTKNDIVNLALAEIGLNRGLYDLQPEEIQPIALKLEMLVMEWSATNINISWPYGTNLSADLSNVPDAAPPAIYLNLAVSIAPLFGKTINAITAQKAQQAYSNLCTTQLVSIPRQYQSGTPLGEGNKYGGYGQGSVWNRFTGRPSQPPLINSSGPLEGLNP